MGFTVGDAIPLAEVSRHLIAAQERNSRIAADVRSAMDEGRWPLVVTERKEHLQTLVDCIGPVAAHVFVLQGGKGVRQRKELLARLATLPPDEPRLLIAIGRYIGEGFDHPRLDTLFLPACRSGPRRHDTQALGPGGRVEIAEKENRSFLLHGKVVAPELGAVRPEMELVLQKMRARDAVKLLTVTPPPVPTPPPPAARPSPGKQRKGVTIQDARKLIKALDRELSDGSEVDLAWTVWERES